MPSRPERHPWGRAFANRASTADASRSHGKNPSHRENEAHEHRADLPVPLPFALQVQTFGRKKTAVAVVHCKAGKGLIRFNGAYPAALRLPLCAVKSL